MKKFYEGVFILRPNLKEEVRTAEIEKVKSIITSFDGTVDKVDEWGQKRLAYEIMKTREGYYIIVSFTSEVDAVNELNRLCKINEQMLRHMVVVDELRK